MTIVEAILLSLSLCVDSLVVSTTTAFHSKISFRRGALMAAVFGLCQGAFPLAGALIGDVARAFIEAVDHWVAFGLLLLVGGKMILDAIRNREEPENRNRPVVDVGTMFLLGVATSIDAFAVGIGMGLEHTMGDVLWTVAMIGGVTFAVSLLEVPCRCGADRLGHENTAGASRRGYAANGVIPLKTIKRCKISVPYSSNH